MKKILISSILIINGALFGALKSGKFGAEFAYNGVLGTYAASDSGSLYISSPGVGFWYHFSEKIAISVKLSGYFTDNNRLYSISAGNEVRANSQTFGGGIGIELPFYVIDFDPVLLFIGPGGSFNYSRSNSTFTNSNGSSAGYDQQTYSSYFSGYAVIGLQFPLHEKLHIFGRTTAGYTGGISRQDVFGNDPSHTRNATVGIQSWGVGIIFYLN